MLLLILYIFYFEDEDDDSIDVDASRCMNDGSWQSALCSMLQGLLMV